MPARIAIDRGWAGDVTPVLSLTVTPNAKGLPLAVVGVPEMAPVAGFRLNPGGNDPDETAQLLYGAMPPLEDKLAV
jgi:hypothetical protein